HRYAWAFLNRPRVIPARRPTLQYPGGRSLNWQQSAAVAIEEQVLVGIYQIEESLGGRHLDVRRPLQHGFEHVAGDASCGREVVGVDAVVGDKAQEAPPHVLREHVTVADADRPALPAGRPGDNWRRRRRGCGWLYRDGWHWPVVTTGDANDVHVDILHDVG